MDIRSLLMKIYIRINEKNRMVEGIKMKYLFFRNSKSKRLIVVFSGWPVRRISTYNYVKTLEKVKDNKLFILDSEGYNQMGTYYLGNSCKWIEYDVIPKLIEYVKTKCGSIEQVIFAGTSKGATCSLLYGLRMNVDAVICGSPQYRIAWYLQNSGNQQLNTFPILIRDSKYNEKEIDSLLEEAIDKAKLTKIYMIYSSGEFLYPYDGCHLIEKLKTSDLECHLYNLIDDGFIEHSDVGRYFKPFFIKKLHDL